MTSRSNRAINLFYDLPRNLVACFSGFNLLWPVLVIALTFVAVSSGFDWAYFKFFRSSILYPFSFAAGGIGALLPILLPLILFVAGKLKDNFHITNMALALGQAALLGSFISSVFKAFTGRVYPPFNLNASLTDVSRVFKFGLLRGGIFWGWPSSHTTIAFAMSVTLIFLYPKNKLIKYLALTYAFLIGLGVSISFHWFSDFVAGAIIGTVIGVVVGKSFYARLLSKGGWFTNSLKTDKLCRQN